MRQAKVSRKTKETQISLQLDLDGKGTAQVDTGIGFLDHMLEQITKHGLFNIQISATGDLEVDEHHTVEDVGICLGKAFSDAIGDGKGINRFGLAALPMDEAMAEVIIDFSGRPYLSFRGELPRGCVGKFDSELVEEFLRAFAINSRTTLHVVLHYGSNLHHCIEAIFKSLGRALSQAVSLNPRSNDIPSTKGVIET